MAGELHGEFVLNGRTFQYEIIEIHDTEERDWKGPDIEDHIEEADTVFYSATSLDDGEEYYRWLGGPFSNIADVQDAISDELDFYESAETSGGDISP
jgi:hypothetical protein